MNEKKINSLGAEMICVKGVQQAISATKSAKQLESREEKMEIIKSAAYKWNKHLSLEIPLSHMYLKAINWKNV